MADIFILAIAYLYRSVPPSMAVCNDSRSYRRWHGRFADRTYLAPATIIIKALISIPFTNKSDKIVTVRNVVSTIIAFAISATGYAIAEAFITYGFTKHAFTGLIAIIPVSVPGSCIQSGGSAIIICYSWTGT